MDLPDESDRSAVGEPGVVKDFRAYLAERWPTPVPLKEVMVMEGAEKHRILADAFARVPDGYVVVKQESLT